MNSGGFPVDGTSVLRKGAQHPGVGEESRDRWCPGVWLPPPPASTMQAPFAWPGGSGQRVRPSTRPAVAGAGCGPGCRPCGVLSHLPQVPWPLAPDTTSLRPLPCLLPPTFQAAPSPESPALCCWSLSRCGPARGHTQHTVTLLFSWPPGEDRFPWFCQLGGTIPLWRALIALMHWLPVNTTRISKKTGKCAQWREKDRRM